MKRLYFVMPEVHKPVGGVNVLINIMNVLLSNGYNATPLYQTSNYKYKYKDIKTQAFYAKELDFLSNRYKKFYGQYLIKKPHNIQFTPSDEDFYIVPEFCYPEFSTTIKLGRKILFVQDVFGFCRAYKRDLKSKEKLIKNFEFIITTSNASSNAVKELTNVNPLFIPQYIDNKNYFPSKNKIRQICYMPRKRPDEIETLTSCLRTQKIFDNWRWKPIFNVAEDERNYIINQSAIFLSFSHQEGFGLPPAEAMSAGCLVVGYTGVGGEEYFDSSLCIKVSDGDIIEFMKSIKYAVNMFDNDRKKFDEMRFAAAQNILMKYNYDEMYNSVTSIFEKITSNN